MLVGGDSHHNPWFEGEGGEGGKGVGGEGKWRRVGGER